MYKLNKILIIDDMLVNRLILKKMLANDYDIIEAKNGKEALEILSFQRRQISAILLDTVMPVMDGYEFLRKIKSNKETASIPVIVMTGEQNRESELKSLEMGANDFLREPFEPSIIRQRLANMVELSQAIRRCRKAEKDGLTGIYNRQAFCEKTSRLIHQHSDKRYVLVLLDIERFKVVNEIFGSSFGDSILIRIAQSLKSNLLGLGTFGRLEADHFAMCFEEELLNADEMVKRVDLGFKRCNLNYNITASFGIYIIENIDVPVDQMCDRAEMALKTIKGNYIRRYAFYDDKLREDMLVEQQIKNEMSAALENKEFCVYFQPIYSISKKVIMGAEALVRWVHPKRGMIMPSIFIPLFEQNGFVTKLDYFVWEEVCKFIAKKKAEGGSLSYVPISVNVSRTNFYNPFFFEDIMYLVNKYNIEPQFLKLEITESAYTDNPRELLDATKLLKKAGFQILMDDFGSGYSSLNMLKDVPADILKIDMKFIDNLEISGRAGNVVSSIVRMAKWLDMSVVAEGVETKAQVDFMRSIGCDSVQGFYFSKPIPQEDFERLWDEDCTHKEESKKIIADKLDLDSVWEANGYVNLILNGIVDAIGIYEFFGNTLEPIRVNDGYYELTGSSPQNFLSKTNNVLDFLNDRDRMLLISKCEEGKRTGKNVRVCISRRHESGRTIIVEIKIKYLGKKGKSSLLCFVMNDITDEKEIEQENYLKLYSSALLNVYEAIFELNFTDNLVTPILKTESYKTIPDKKYALQEWLNGYAQKYIHPLDREKYLAQLSERNIEDKLFLDKKNSVKVIFRQINHRNEYEWILTEILVVSDLMGKKICLACMKKISDKRFIGGLGYSKLLEYSSLLRKKAEIDGLSGLLNRITCEEKMNFWFVNEVREGTFLLFDIDNFKTVNDTFGHTLGDKYISKFAEILASECSFEDIAGRVGGDEFVIFTPNVNREIIEAKVESILKNSKIIGAELGFDVEITVSAGGSRFPDDGNTFNQLYQSADRSLYGAKKDGKNCLRFFGDEAPCL